MQFEIFHLTEYTYSEEVFFEPHYFRFKPKSTPFLSVKYFQEEIEPIPSGLSEQIDIENNYISFGWFNGMHEKMVIKSNSRIEVSEYNPFNFLVHPSAYLKIPFEYDSSLKQLLKPSLHTEYIPIEVTKYVDDMLSLANYKSVDFLLELTKKIHEDFKLESREIGKPYPPSHTFEIKTGSCRDLSWMQIQMLRQLGIACRYVSGYFYVNVEDPEFELHAWVEAYLPGAGWIGLDPSHGILTSGYHIPVASSAFVENTMPVSGTTRGASESKLNHQLQITQSD